MTASAARGYNEGEMRAGRQAGGQAGGQVGGQAGGQAGGISRSSSAPLCVLRRAGGSAP